LLNPYALTREGGTELSGATVASIFSAAKKFVTKRIAAHFSQEEETPPHIAIELAAQSASFRRAHE